MTTDPSPAVAPPARFPAPVRAGVAALAALAPGLTARALAELCMRTPRQRAPRHERGVAGAEPFTIRYGRGAVLRGWSRGHGPAVLLLHGWGGRTAQLAPLAEALVAGGLAAVAVDAPGHGSSSGRVASVPLYAEAIAAAQSATGARAAVGHSFGGAALAFAAARGLRVDAAVLVGAPSTPVRWVEAFCDSLGLPTAARAALRARLEARVGHRYEELDLIRTVDRARPAALVVHDRDDREVPFAGGEALAAAWPGARLHATAGLGHRRILRDHAVLAAIAAFVAGVLPRCACGKLAAHTGPDGERRCAGCAVANDLWERWRRQERGAGRPTGS